MIFTILAVASYSDTDDTMRIAINGVETISNDALASGTMLDASTVLNIGATAGSAFDGYYSQVMVFNTGLTPQEAGELYQESLLESFVTKTDIQRLRKTDETSYAAYIADGTGWNNTLDNQTAGLIENSEFDIIGGTWAIGDEEDGTAKSLQCVVAGSVGIESKVAYGTWEFDWFKVSGYNAISFIASQLGARDGAWQTGYELNNRTTSDMTVLERINGASAGTHLTSAAATFPLSTYFRVRITRTSLGVFSFYLSTDGGDTFTLIPATAGSNPFTDTTVTSCSYIVLLATAGSKFKNFSFIEDGY